MAGHQGYLVGGLVQEQVEAACHGDVSLLGGDCQGGGPGVVDHVEQLPGNQIAMGDPFGINIRGTGGDGRYEDLGGVVLRKAEAGQGDRDVQPRGRGQEVLSASGIADRTPRLGNPPADLKPPPAADTSHLSPRPGTGTPRYPQAMPSHVPGQGRWWQARRVKR